MVTYFAQSGPGEAADAASFAAVMAWWRDAGVDNSFADSPRDWIEASQPATVETAQISAPAPVVTAPPRERIGGDPADWPQELAAFPAWWLSEPSLGAGIEMRVAPQGKAGSPLMVLTDQPEESDRESLLSGAQGKLLDAILAALDTTREQTYLASALPRHMPLPDWDAIATDGLGEVLSHHIRLAAPKRLIVLGGHVSSLLGHDPAKSAEPLRQFYHEGGSIPALAAPSLPALALRPRNKARLWTALLNWTGLDWTGTELT